MFPVSCTTYCTVDLRYFILVLQAMNCYDITKKAWVWQAVSRCRQRGAFLLHDPSFGYARLAHTAASGHAGTASRPKSARLPMRPQTAPRPTNAHQQEQIWMPRRKGRPPVLHTILWMELQSYVDLLSLDRQLLRTMQSRGEKPQLAGAKLMTIT